MKIVWAIFNERGSFGEKVLWKVYEDEAEARQAIRGNSLLSGKSVEFVPAQRRGLSQAALNELAGHEEDASS